jgi:hypothetical protein
MVKIDIYNQMISHLFLSAVVTPFSGICCFNKKPSFTLEKPVPIILPVFTKRAGTDG